MQCIWLWFVQGLLPDTQLRQRLYSTDVLEGESVTLGEIARRFGATYESRRRGKMRDEEFRALRAIAACRTALCGWRRFRCRECHKPSTAFNSCGNRDCPGCQNGKRHAWLEARRRQLLPVPYFHVIVPLPALLSQLALYNRTLIFELLFANVEATIKEVARKQCGLAEIGYLAVLHTWGQKLQHHVHLHLIVPGGGLTPEGEWKTLSEKFFLPVPVLRNVFRTKFLYALLDAHERGDLTIPKQSEHVDYSTFEQLYGRLLEKQWVVHVKPPVHGDSKTVLKYLARYVYRAGISNSRLLKLEGDQVTFSYKDYAQEGCPQRQMTTAADQFLELFLRHVSPRGFKRVRYVGFWAGPHATQRIDSIHRQIRENTPAQTHDVPADSVPRQSDDINSVNTPTCPHCGSDDLLLIEECDRHQCNWMWDFQWDIFPSWKPLTYDTS